MKTLIKKTTIAIVAMATLAATPVMATSPANAADKTLAGITGCNFSTGGCASQKAKAADPMVVAGNGWKKAIVGGAIAGAVAGTIASSRRGGYVRNCWWETHYYWRYGVRHARRVKVCN